MKSFLSFSILILLSIATFSTKSFALKESDDSERLFVDEATMRQVVLTIRALENDMAELTREEGKEFFTHGHPALQYQELTQKWLPSFRKKAEGHLSEFAYAVRSLYAAHFESRYISGSLLFELINFHTAEIKIAGTLTNRGAEQLSLARTVRIANRDVSFVLRSEPLAVPYSERHKVYRFHGQDEGDIVATLLSHVQLSPVHQDGLVFKKLNHQVSAEQLIILAQNQWALTDKFRQVILGLIAQRADRNAIVEKLNRIPDFSGNADFAWIKPQDCSDKFSSGYSGSGPQ